MDRSSQSPGWKIALWSVLPVVLVGVALLIGFSVPDEPGPLVVRDVAAEAGIQDQTQTDGENCVHDLDGDGRLDLILSTHRESAWPLYRGVGGGRFVLDTSVDFERSDRHTCAVADFDGDGLLDVYMSVGACQGTCEGPKELWRQRADGTFIEEAAQWGVDDPLARGRDTVVLDANGDGRPDLFTGARAGVDNPSPNRLWINQGDRFVEQRDALVHELGNWSSAGGDLDGDGRPEVVMSTEEGLFAYRNVDGTYVEDTESFGLTTFGRRKVEIVDVDLDDDLDFVWVTGDVIQVMRNDGTGLLEEAFTLDVEDGLDVALGDVDGDGDLDLYVQQGERTSLLDRVWLNDGDATSFQPGPRLPGTADAGNSVGVIPEWRGTGRDAFLVNNGLRDEPGPGKRQLFVFSGG